MLPTMYDDTLFGSDSRTLIIAAAIVAVILLALAVGIAYAAPIVGQAVHEAAPDVLLDWPGRATV